jgi:hypothetical protein
MWKSEGGTLPSGERPRSLPRGLDPGSERMRDLWNARRASMQRRLRRGCSVWHHVRCVWRHRADAMPSLAVHRRAAVAFPVVVAVHAFRNMDALRHAAIERRQESRNRRKRRGRGTGPSGAVLRSGLGAAQRPPKWITRSKSTAEYRLIRHLGPGDDLVEFEVSREARRKDPSLPTRFDARAISYERKGYRPQCLLTSMVDAERSQLPTCVRSTTSAGRSSLASVRSKPTCSSGWRRFAARTPRAAASAAAAAAWACRS